MPTQSQSLRILVVRLGAMGDILHALPAVTALRAALDTNHPASCIGWAIEPQWTPLLCAESCGENCEHGPQMPIVDRLHRVPAKQWARKPLSLSTLGEIRRLRGALRAQQYDICIDLQGAIRSAWIGRMAKAPRMIGEADPREPLARWLFRERVATTGVHVVEQANEVVTAIFKEDLAYETPALPVDPVAENWCDTWLAERGIERFVLMNPGAGWGAKCWPAERYASVAAELPAMGLATIVNIGPGESKFANAFSPDLDARVFPMIGSIGQLIACTRRASLFIGGDTGPLHLAAALNIPVVGIYGPTNPARNGPYRTRAIVLRHPASKRDHTRRSAPETGLMTITVQDVLEAVQKLLQPQAAAQ
ncbi:MAG TPA: glycosyltransferase family 9 protein [Acidobacteriaceae bacterium]|nr:glycosyltransferase family 9 protein [Acidobacteriaceae bacterium]